MMRQKPRYGSKIDTKTEKPSGQNGKILQRLLDQQGYYRVQNKTTFFSGTGWMT